MLPFYFLFVVFALNANILMKAACLSYLSNHAILPLNSIGKMVSEGNKLEQWQTTLVNKEDQIFCHTDAFVLGFIFV